MMTQISSWGDSPRQVSSRDASQDPGWSNPQMLQQMTKLRFLGLEIFFVVRVGWSANWHLLDHFQSVTFQANDFLRVVGQKPELAHAEVEKDLRTKSVVAQIGREPEFRVGL